MPQRISELDEIGDLGAPPGSRPWAVAVILQARLAIEVAESDAQHAGHWIELLKQHQAWQPLGLASFGLLCAKRLKISEEEADALSTAKRGETVATVLAKAREEGPPPKTGEVGRGRSSVVRPNPSAGNSQSYLARRLLRDAPEVFEALERGEFKSVRAAAIAAGIVKPDTPATRLRKAWEKASEAERAEVAATRIVGNMPSESQQSNAEPSFGAELDALLERHRKLDTPLCVIRSVLENRLIAVQEQEQET